ncbi:MAG: HAMP domain-containing protein, partial [Coriobacteriales bacterium]|nr:HAMP domain-containing protein [Coriobacteriales bacterium]
MRASGVLGASGVPGASRAQKTPKAPKEQRFGLRSVYARFALVFLGIWWVSNAATLIMIFSLIPESRADEVRSLIGLIFINNAVFGTIVILLALRGVVKPIKLLSSAAREVAEGNFALTVDVRSRDEIGGLAANFNTMITEIAGTDKMRREFVSNVSHEFRTPMTSIHGFAKLIDENAEDREAVREYSN